MSYYDRQGKLTTLIELSEKFEDMEYKIVKRTIVGEYTVSTVWLGLDHNLFKGNPLIFETMIFYKDRNSLDYQERYSTEEEALLGHEIAIRHASMVGEKQGFQEVENETD